MSHIIQCACKLSFKTIESTTKLNIHAATVTYSYIPNYVKSPLDQAHDSSDRRQLISNRRRQRLEFQRERTTMLIIFKWTETLIKQVMKRSHDWEECFKEREGVMIRICTFSYFVHCFFFFINSQVTYVLYLLFTRRIAGGFSWVLLWKTPIKLPARQATSRTLIFDSSSRVTLTNFLPPWILK